MQVKHPVGPDMSTTYPEEKGWNQMQFGRVPAKA